MRRISSSVCDSACFLRSVFSILVTIYMVFLTWLVKYSFWRSMSRRLSIYSASTFVESSLDLFFSMFCAISCELTAELATALSRCGVMR